MRVTLVGGPTALVEFGDLRLVTDPTFDPPGEQPRGLLKLSGPAIQADAVGRVDAVLLSHDHHPDNLDRRGRLLLERADRIVTTTAAAVRLGGAAVGLEPWASLELARQGASTVSVTAVPARHGPEGSDEVMGPVIGFVLTADGLPSLYVSGDNASLDVVRAIAERLGPIELAILFAGRARLAQRFDGADLTLSSEHAAEAARILNLRAVVPVHFHGWQHFTEGAESLRAAFAAAGLSDRLALAQPGETVTI